MLTKIHIFDLDGVLVDSSHRYRNLSNGAIDLEYWRAHALPIFMERDTLLPMAKQYKSDLRNPEVYTVICTSRAYHQDNINYIYDHLGLPDKLIMRPVGNLETDHLLKFRQLQRILNLKQFSKLTKRFWDDNVKSVYVVSELGVQCCLIESNQGAR